LKSAGGFARKFKTRREKMMKPTLIKQILISLITVIGLAITANAATLSVTSDASTYAPGATITLTVSGDAEGASTTAVFAQVLFSGDSSFVSSSQQGQTSFSGGLPWASGALTSGAGFADALNQIAGLSALPADNLFSATIVLTAGSAGTVATSFNTTPGANLLDFYGASGTGGTFTIVPEPTTAGLLGLGLLSLAVVGRRR
jgi:hypothetical protein